MSNKYLAGVGLVEVFSPGKGSLIRAFCPAMGPLQLSSHMIQNCQTGEQMTHWDKFNKENLTTTTTTTTKTLFEQ